jgi:hypothetical protein
MQVKTIVIGIKVSTNEAEMEMTSRDDMANVSECPIVKAVTKIRTFLQSLSKYIAQSATTNKM